MCVCMYLCMDICMFYYICLYTSLSVLIYILSIYTYVHVCVCIYVYMQSILAVGYRERAKNFLLNIREEQRHFPDLPQRSSERSTFVKGSSLSWSLTNVCTGFPLWGIREGRDHLLGYKERAGPFLWGKRESKDLPEPSQRSLDGQDLCEGRKFHLTFEKILERAGPSWRSAWVLPLGCMTLLFHVSWKTGTFPKVCMGPSFEVWWKDRNLPWGIWGGQRPSLDHQDGLHSDLPLRYKRSTERPSQIFIKVTRRYNGCQIPRTLQRSWEGQNINEHLHFSLGPYFGYMSGLVHTAWRTGTFTKVGTGSFSLRCKGRGRHFCCGNNRRAWTFTAPHLMKVTRKYKGRAETFLWGIRVGQGSSRDLHKGSWKG